MTIAEIISFRVISRDYFSSSSIHLVIFHSTLAPVVHRIFLSSRKIYGYRESDLSMSSSHPFVLYFWSPDNLNYKDN